MVVPNPYQFGTSGLKCVQCNVSIYLEPFVRCYIHNWHCECLLYTFPDFEWFNLNNIRDKCFVHDTVDPLNSVDHIWNTQL